MMIRSFLRTCHIASQLACALALTLAIPAATAATGGTSAAIDKFMARYARDLAAQLGSHTRVEYTVPALTTSVEARTCPNPLAIAARDQAQSMTRVTLYVACGNDWSIYVPVDLDVYRPVVVATRPLATGDVVSAGDIDMTSLDVGRLSGTYLTAPDDAVGMGVKRPIMAGRPLLAQQLEPPLLIHRGEAVIITAEADALAVKMTGTALTDGHRGEQIRVRNQATSRIVEARVVAPGHVIVPM